MSEVPGSGVSERWIEWRRTVDLIKYDQRWDAMAARGDSIHGEADFVERNGSSVNVKSVCLMPDAEPVV